MNLGVSPPFVFLVDVLIWEASPSISKETGTAGSIHSHQIGFCWPHLGKAFGTVKSKDLTTQNNPKGQKVEVFWSIFGGESKEQHLEADEVDEQRPLDNQCCYMVVRSQMRVFLFLQLRLRQPVAPLHVRRTT